MDIEQLKLVLETAQGIGVQAQAIAIVWILLDKLLPVVCWMTVFVTLLWKIPTFVRLFAGSDAFMIWARDALRIGSPGYLADYERRVVEQKLRELVLEHINGKSNDNGRTGQ